MNNPAMLLHALKGPAATCLLALMLAPSPVTARWISQVTGYAPNTVTQALSLLEQLDMAAHDGNRSGWRTDLQMSRPEPGPAAYSGEDIAKCDALKLEADSIKLKAIKDSSLLASAKNSSHSATAAAGAIAEPGEATPTAENLPEEELRSADVPRLLEATDVLFGEPVVAPRGREVQPGLALAWIAKAYDQRYRLRKPARVVYAGLKRGEPPEERYLDDPLSRLPARYLVAAGLHPPPEPGDLPLEPEDEPLAAETGEPEPPDHPSLALPVSAGSSLSAAQAWQRALDIARQSVAAPLFHDYLLPVRLHAYDPETGAFTLEAENDYALAMLESRLQKLLARWLSGICSRSIEVRFTCETL